ncbi:MAG TPA: hypothetical protein VGO80_09730 [Solirubrobacteraceae bacterium]|jgi:hypothetical protein|nr:hypothetical protein [Solirubrobacteraceae bacterium]
MRPATCTSMSLTYGTPVGVVVAAWSDEPFGTRPIVELSGI